MYSGQGKIGKIDSSQLQNKTKGSKSEVRIFLNMQPKLQWKFLPTKAPQDIPNGGFVYSPNSLKGNELNVYGVGFGNGGFVEIGLNSATLMMSAFYQRNLIYLNFLCIIAVILLLTAAIWAIRSLILTQSDDRRRQYKRRTPGKQVEEMKIYNPVLELKQSPRISPYPISFGTSNLLPSNSGERFPFEMHTDVRNNQKDDRKSLSTNSILSNTPSAIIDDPAKMIPVTVVSKNQIVECHDSTLVLTVSNGNCPNVWQKESGNSITLFERSRYSECTKLFVMNETRLVVGVMRNYEFSNEESYVLQMWTTSDGKLLNKVPINWNENAISCRAVTVARDSFIICLSRNSLITWFFTTNRSTSVPCSLHIGRNDIISMEVTKDEKNVLIVLYNHQNVTLTLYSYSLDGLCQGYPVSKSKQYYSTISCYDFFDSSVLIATRNGNIISWNINTDEETNLKNFINHDIWKLMLSRNGETVAVQLDNYIRIFYVNPWKEISKIAVNSNQICYFAMSEWQRNSNLLTISVATGEIILYEIFLGQQIQMFSMPCPISFISYSSDETTLIAIGDKISQYNVFFVDISDYII